MAERIMLALRFCTRDGGGLVPDPAHDNCGMGQPPNLAGKKIILNKCLESAKQSGADKIIISATGDVSLMKDWPELFDIPVYFGGADPNMQEGDMNNIRKSAEVAKAEGFDWLFSICGDVYHVHSNWARRTIAQAKPGSELVTCVIQEGVHNAVVNRLFAARPEFVLKTYPTYLKCTDAGEINWRDNIRRLGVWNKWTIQPSMVNGHPTGPLLHYLHAHRVEEIKDWKMESET